MINAPTIALMKSRASLAVRLMLCLLFAGDVVSAERVVTLRGRIVDATTMQPIPGAFVLFEAQTATADAQGRFSLDVPAAAREVTISAEHFDSRHEAVSVLEAASPDAEIALLPKGYFTEEIDVVASREITAAQPSTIPVKPLDVMSVAGGAENVFRVLQTLPGVSGTDEFSSRLSVRGGGPDQNLTVMDGIEIHNPYRLFGLVSAFNPETVDGFELTAGAFSAKYGDRLSSILVVDNRAGLAGRPFAGSTALSMTDANVIAEGGLPRNKGSWLVTGRRTYYDLIVERFIDSDLPSFSDLQGKLVWDLGHGHHLTLFGLTSREGTDASFTGDDYDGAIYARTRNDLVSSTLFMPIGRHGSSRTIAAFYENTEEADFGGRFKDEGRRSNAPGDEGFARTNFKVTWSGVVRDASFRQELVLQPAARHVVEAGFEAHRLRNVVDLRIPGARNPTEANSSSIQGGIGLPDVLESRRSDTRAGAWLLDRLRLSNALEVEAGLRLDRSSINARTDVSPRFSSRLALGSSTRLRAAAGIHRQSPGYEKLVQADYLMEFNDDGALDLDNERSGHLLLGVERDLTAGVTARIEAYYKSFDRLIIGRLENAAQTQARISRYDFPLELVESVPSETIITTDPVNDGRGKAYGFDVYVARRATSPRTRLSGWASYTYGIADRRCYGRTYPFDYDRRHAATAVFNWRLSDRFMLALTGRLASGFPITLPKGLRVSAVTDSEDGDGDGDREELIPEHDANGLLVYYPYLGDVSTLNDGRQPAYARVDARLTYTPGWGGGRARLYLDVINLLNRKNPGMIERTLEHDPDSDRPRIVESREGSIPFIPSFGVHVRF
ncbi:MAG: TonB-dependent receptor [Vicinamibacteria bacterium]|nr:TonB-dependent receptor [Vicinamibacteria bacterium]